MRLNPPSIFVFLISVLLAVLALVSKFGAIGINVPRYLPHQEYWLAMVAYMVLMVGNLVRGLVAGARFRPDPVNTKYAPAAISAKPMAWFQVSGSLR